MLKLNKCYCFKVINFEFYLFHFFLLRYQMYEHFRYALYLIIMLIYAYYFFFETFLQIKFIKLQINFHIIVSFLKNQNFMSVL